MLLGVLAVVVPPCVPGPLPHPIQARPDAVTAAPVADDSVLWLDVGRVLPSVTRLEPEVNLTTHLRSAHHGNPEPDRYDLDLGPEPAASPEALVGWLRAAASRAEGARIDDITLFPGRIRVDGNAQARAAAREAWAALKSVLHDTVDIELLRIDDDRLEPGSPAVVGADAAASFVSALGGVQHSIQTVRVGCSTRLADAGASTFIDEVQVEVAQGAVGPESTVAVMREGLEVGVRVDRASDGRRWLLRVWGRDGEIVRPLRVVELQALGETPLELPSVKTSLFCASALVEPGELLVVDHDGGGREALAVRVRPRTEPAAPAAFVALGEALATPMRMDWWRVPMVSPSHGWSRYEYDRAGARRWKDADSIEHFLADVVGDRSTAGILAPIGSGACLLASDPAAETIRTALHEFAASLPVRTVTAEFRYDIVDRETAAGVWTDEGVRAFAAAAEGRRLGAAIVHDDLVLLGGTEVRYLKSHRARIASGAATVQPSTELVFDGLSLRCHPVGVDRGRVRAWIDVQAQSVDRALRQQSGAWYVPARRDGESNRPDLAGRFRKNLTIDLPRNTRASARTLVHPRMDEWTLVCAQAMGGSDESLVVVARFGVR